MSNKFFVIGGNYENTCEVLVGITNKFVLIKSLPKLKDNQSYFVSNIEAVSIGYKIYVYRGMKRRTKINELYVTEIRSDMLILSYNDEQNAFVKENDLHFEGEKFSCARVSKQ